MTNADSGLVLIIVAVSALRAYACVPRDTFRTIKSRMRWGIFFLLTFLAIAAIRSWDKRYASGLPDQQATAEQIER